MSNGALLLAAQCEASGDHVTASVMRELVAENERLRAALKPFADTDGRVDYTICSIIAVVDADDIRRAREALGESK